MVMSKTYPRRTVPQATITRGQEMGRTLTQYRPAGRPARSMGTRHTDGRVELAGSIHRTTRSGPRFCSPEQWAGTLSPVDSNFKASSLLHALPAFHTPII